MQTAMHRTTRVVNPKSDVLSLRYRRQHTRSTRATERRTAVSVAATQHQSPDPDDGPSTSGSHDELISQPYSRRQVALGVAATISAIAGAEPVLAAKTITLRDGTQLQAYEHGMSLSIVALRGSVPSRWALDFKTSIGRYCGFSLDQRAQLEDIFKELSDTSGRNRRSAGLADVVTLGDSWLGPAVQRGLLQPLPGTPQHQRWYRLLPQRMRQLVQRDEQGRVDPQGRVYGAPYRWGCTLIAYRRDRLLRRGGRPVLDWGDLLQPALRGRVAMVDDPRELLAAALRSLGVGVGEEGGEGGVGEGGERMLSVNASARELAAAGVTEQVLQERVAALRRQVRLFSSRDHVRALQAGDVWAVVGSSQDLVQLAERGSNVALVAPLSGTQLWADVWAVPAGAKGGHRQQGPSPLLPVWFEFTLAPGRLAGQPGLKGGAPSALFPARDLPPSSAPLLSALRQHRSHLQATRAAAQRRGNPLTAALGATLGQLPPLQPLLQPLLGSGAGEGRQEEEQGERNPHGLSHPSSSPSTSSSSSSSSSSSASSVVGLSYGGDQDQDLGLDPAGQGDVYDNHGGYDFPAVELRHGNGYLPPPLVLQRSEFLLPAPDEETLQMYRRVLLAGEGKEETTN